MLYRKEFTDCKGDRVITGGTNAQLNIIPTFVKVTGTLEKWKNKVKRTRLLKHGLVHRKKD